MLFSALLFLCPLLAHAQGLISFIIMVKELTFCHLKVMGVYFVVLVFCLACSSSIYYILKCMLSVRKKEHT